jgi:hypothetical protein
MRNEIVASIPFEWFFVDQLKGALTVFGHLQGFPCDQFRPRGQWIGRQLILWLCEKPNVPLPAFLVHAIYQRSE